MTETNAPTPSPFDVANRIAGTCDNCSSEFQEVAYTVSFREYRLNKGIVNLVDSRPTILTEYADYKPSEYSLCTRCVTCVIEKCNKYNQT